MKFGAQTNASTDIRGLKQAAGMCATSGSEDKPTRSAALKGAKCNFNRVLTMPSRRRHDTDSRGLAVGY
jgi:hypothetical protein